MTARVAHVDNGCLQSLPLISTTLRSHIVDLTASHTLTQVYSNSSTRDISEAQYTFPLYESSSVTGFQALVGEKTIKGVVKERSEAKAIYETAKSAGKVAALFSQDTSEVFTTSVGNIPGGGLVVVVIKYVHELKQDIEVDGVKLVIPTVIAPKYGNAPAATGLVFGDRWRTSWGNFSQDILDIGNAEDAGLSLSVTATMSGPIRGVISPTHPISIGLGSHSSADDTDFNPTKAHATLALASQSLTGLDKDFSLLIKTNDIGDPRAFLAPHPTLKDMSTLMVTMVPKFALPSQGHEIIFVVDRSGSMEDKIATVRSALKLFLSSLPVGLYFNICSFGSNHSFLWSRSEKYSEVSLNTAKAHVVGLDSEMGGTEMLQAVMGAMNTRRRDMRTEFLILTDGEVWDAEGMFEFVGECSKGGNVRFFSLGVGNTVSHSLVEGISRAGRGYSQIVNIASNLQKKVMRMLKAALTRHVNDWDISWVGKLEKQCATLVPSAPRTVAPISLFDPDHDPDNTPFSPSSNALTLTLPKVIQAPAVIPGLFSYSRTTVYFLISNGDRPEKVSLKGSTHVASSNTICPLQIEIPVQEITSTGASLGLYQLAGRKLLQDFEEGRLSYLEGIYDKAREPTEYAELITKEGTRVGVEFGLASKWTSFVAVVGDESTGERQTNRGGGEVIDALTRGGAQTAGFGPASSSQRADPGGGLAGEGKEDQQEGDITGVCTRGESQTDIFGSASSSSRKAVGRGESTGEERANRQGALVRRGAQIAKFGSASTSRQAVAKEGPTGGGRASQRLEKRQDVVTDGETQAPNFGSARSSSQRPGHSKSASGSGSAAKRVSASPGLQQRDYTCRQKRAQQQKLSGGQSEGSGAPPIVSGSGSNFRGSLFGGSPSPLPQTFTQPSGPFRHPTGGARARSGSFGAAPAPSSRPVQVRRKSLSSKPITQDGRDLNLIKETVALLASPVHKQKVSSRISSSSPALNPSSPRYVPSSPSETPPASPVFSPTSPRHAANRYITTPPSRSPASPSQARYAVQVPRPAPRLRACCAARLAASPSHSLPPPPKVSGAATTPSPSPASPPQISCITEEPRSPSPQVPCTVQYPRPITPPSPSPAPPPQVYYVAQDPLDYFDPFTSGPLQQCQQQESQWIPEESQNLVSDLATLPQFDGMFKADERIFTWLDLRDSGLERAHADTDFVVTIAVIIALENKFPELMEEWELMISKAKEAVQNLYSEGDREAVASAVRAALGV